MSILKTIKAWLKEGSDSQQQQILYHPLHVSYITKDDKGNTVNGEMLVLLEHGENIRQLRELVRNSINKKNVYGTFQTPVLTSITELSIGLYRSLLPSDIEKED